MAPGFFSEFTVIQRVFEDGKDNPINSPPKEALNKNNAIVERPNLQWALVTPLFEVLEGLG